MAKLMELPDLRQMEEKLGHSLYPPAEASSVAGRYYTDLKPVSDDSLRQFVREYTESMAMDSCGVSELSLPLVGDILKHPRL